MDMQKKRCCQCNRIVDGNYNFCTNCGSSHFELVEETIVPEKNMESIPVPVQENNVFSSMSEPIKPVKKKRSVGKMIAIIAAVILVFFLFIIMISSGSSDESTNNIPMVEYTTGEIVDNIYYNEWADLKIVIPDGYVNASEELYNSKESETSDYLLMIQDSLGSNMIIQTESMDEYSYMSEEDCLDELSSVIEEQFLTTYAEYEPTFTFLTENQTMQIANNKYYYCSYEASFKMLETRIVMLQDLFVRKIDNRLLVIAISSDSRAELEQLLSSISNYEPHENDNVVNNNDDDVIVQTYELSSELSKDIDSFQVQIMDVVYQFPMTYDDFAATGWSVYKEYYSVDTQIESGFEELIKFEKNGMLMCCFVYNADISIQTVDKCIISGILSLEPIDNDELHVFIPGGFKVGEAKKEEVLAAFREPDRIDEMDNGATYVTYETDNVYIATELTFDENGILYDIALDIPQEPEGFQYSEVDTSYIAPYVVPTEMTDKLTDRIVRFEGDLYQLPVTVSAMMENGWATTDATEAVAGGSIYFTDLERNGETLSVTVHNYEDSAIEVSQGYIEELEEYLSDSDFEVSGGITMQMTESDFLSFIENNDFEYGVEHREDGNLYKICYGEDDLETYLRVKFSAVEVEYINIGAGEEWIK